MKMQEWKIQHKTTGGGKCRNGKSGKRKVWNAVCQIIIFHYAYRMHEVNNAAKDASLLSAGCHGLFGPLSQTEITEGVSFE